MERAQWFPADGAPEDAIPDLTAVAESARNSGDVQQQALALLSEIRGNGAPAKLAV